MGDTDRKLRITLIDGQGGGIGKQLVAGIKANCADAGDGRRCGAKRREKNPDTGEPL